MAILLFGRDNLYLPGFQGDFSFLRNLFFYSNFRNLLFKEELIQEGHPLYKLEKKEELTWEKLMITLNFLLAKTYQFPLSSSSSLPSRVNRIAFPYVAKRYLFEKVMNVVKNQGDSLKYVLACCGAFLSGSAIFYNENAKQALEQEKIRLERDRLKVDAQKGDIELYKAKTNFHIKLQELDSNTRNVLIKQNTELYEFYKKHKEYDLAKKILLDTDKLRDLAVPVLRDPEALVISGDLKKTAFEGHLSCDFFTYFV